MANFAGSRVLRDQVLGQRNEGRRNLRRLGPRRGETHG
jgi:hypothetical protein